MIKHGEKTLKMYLLRLIIIPILIINFSNSKAALINVEAAGIYGGFWRDLYKLGPVVIDTIGADLGVFGNPSLKWGCLLLLLWDYFLQMKTMTSLAQLVKALRSTTVF